MSTALVAFVGLYQFELDLKLFVGAAMTMLEMAVLCAFAVLFSVVTKPILGSVLTFTVFVVGHLTHGLWLLTDRLKDAVSNTVIAFIYYILPNLERFNFKTELVHDLPIPIAAAAWALAYAIIYSVLVLFLAWMQFSKKDLV